MDHHINPIVLLCVLQDCFDAPAELDAPAVTDTVETQKILSSNQTEEASGKRKETSSPFYKQGTKTQED